MFGAEKPKPKELEPIVAPITVRPAWNQSIGAVQFPLTVAVNGNVLTLAASDGSVLAVEADSGRAVWRANVGAKISAGVGSDGSIAAVVTRDGELVALEGGQVKWKKVVGGSRRDRAAGRRRPHLRPRRRPHRARLRRQRRHQAAGRCSGPATR